MSVCSGHNNNNDDNNNVSLCDLGIGAVFQSTQECKLKLKQSSHFFSFTLFLWDMIYHSIKFLLFFSTDNNFAMPAAAADLST